MKPKNPETLFPLFVTDKLAETKAYYSERAGFEITHDLPNYLQVRYGKPDDAPTLCFMLPDAFPGGKTLPRYGGEGVIVSIPTASADETHERLKQAGAPILSQPEDKPWGWRSFFSVDPNGVMLDFFHVVRENPMGGDASS